MDDLISRQFAINHLKKRLYETALNNMSGDDELYSEIADNRIHVWVNEIPSAQPERIQNNAVHLCDSCQYTYVTCPSHGNDAVFGDGKGNDNICACNKYRPISAQPKLNKEKISDLLWNEYQEMSSHLSTEGVVARRYFCKELWKELFGEEETPVWMTW